MKPARVLPPARGPTTVLSDLRRFHDDLIIPQARLNDYIAWLMTTASCVGEAASSEAEARRTLFGDGFIRYQLGPGQLPRAGAGLELRAACETVLPGTLDEMTWDLTPHAFHMYLSPDVPVRIRDHLEGFVAGLARQIGFEPRELLDKAVFAIHPGGPRIIGFIQEHLGLRPEQCAHSWNVLKTRGNMSSATVPYIWKAIVEDDAVPVGTPVVSMGFGPGLTAAGLLAEKVGPRGLG